MLNSAPQLPTSVGVVGLGLMGASLLGALRQRCPEIRRVGVARRADTAERAVADGLCHAAAVDESALGGVDVVVLCVPVSAMDESLARLAVALPSATLVTDVGSTKADVVATGERLFGERFLGGHPMAGREASGYQAGDAALFQGCTWIVTPYARGRAGDSEGSPDHAVPGLWLGWAEVIRRLGGHIVVLDAGDHDRAAALISHLPALLSAVLMEAAVASPSWPVAGPLAATGFSGMVRLAGGDPTMYAAIMRTNRVAVGEALDSYIAELTRARLAIGGGDHGKGYFQAAQHHRATWMASRGE